jgi:peptidylprolyl isomerase
MLHLAGAVTALLVAPGVFAGTPPADAVRTASGLASSVLRPGTGSTHPAPDALVRVHYTGWTSNGTRVDSSVERGKPLVFPVDRVIAGLGEGFQLMTVGEKRRLWIPGPLAYDRSPRVGVPRGMLVFDVELLEILPPPRKPGPTRQAR